MAPVAQQPILSEQPALISSKSGCWCWKGPISSVPYSQVPTSFSQICFFHSSESSDGWSHEHTLLRNAVSPSHQLLFYEPQWRCWLLTYLLQFFKQYTPSEQRLQLLPWFPSTPGQEVPAAGWTPRSWLCTAASALHTTQIILYKQSPPFTSLSQGWKGPRKISNPTHTLPMNRFIKKSTWKTSSVHKHATKSDFHPLALQPGHQTSSPLNIWAVYLEVYGKKCSADLKSNFTCKQQHLPRTSNKIWSEIGNWLPIDGDLKGYLSGRSTLTFHTPPS